MLVCVGAGLHVYILLLYACVRVGHSCVCMCVVVCACVRSCVCACSVVSYLLACMFVKLVFTHSFRPQTICQLYHQGSYSIQVSIQLYCAHLSSTSVTVVCKTKTHKRCAYQVQQSCKWTTISCLEKDGIEVQGDVSVHLQTHIVYCLDYLA